ncbi:hypothetical protein QWM81_26750 [Streptomyces ficellus]|uniref:Uncharacterized protein n=1 Tax=Streptomyces ficellus TaxID=1977088 RepID=A0ABT7ZDS9_9ACTN|nr:hypothetical protein [Streptomyces ficellus]MDN3297571.1 hypothetical protein [Streptomyces ficellus]
MGTGTRRIGRKHGGGATAALLGALLLVFRGEPRVSVAAPGEGLAEGFGSLIAGLATGARVGEHDGDTLAELALHRDAAVTRGRAVLGEADSRSG